MKRSLMKSVFLATTITFFTFCGSDSKRNLIILPLKEFNKEVYIPQSANWEIVEYINGNDIRIISIKTLEYDTIYEIGYTIRYKEPILTEFSKTYKQEGYYYKIVLNYNDTIYFYKSLTDSFQDKIFIKGKYRYYANKNLFSRGQRDFFLEHSDSLIKIYGDPIPILPSKP